MFFLSPALVWTKPRIVFKLLQTTKKTMEKMKRRFRRSRAPTWRISLLSFVLFIFWLRWWSAIEVHFYVVHFGCVYLSSISDVLSGSNRSFNHSIVGWWRFWFWRQTVASDAFGFCTFSLRFPVRFVFRAWMIDNMIWGKRRKKGMGPKRIWFWEWVSER